MVGGRAGEALENYFLFASLRVVIEEAMSLPEGEAGKGGVYSFQRMKGPGGKSTDAK